MTAKRFNFGVKIYYKIQDEVKYERRFSDLEGFLEEDYDGEHHMLWDNQEECWVHLDEVLEIMEKEYNTLHEENELLKEALKKEHMSMSGVLCDACKYQEATYTNNWFVGEDFDVQCNKGHEVLIDDDKQECGDFELRISDVE